MARGPAKSFDREAVLDLAMHEFWKHGYAATSISGLREVTGLGAKSLYDTFGDKRSIYLACLERYDRVVLTRMFDAVIARHPPKVALTRILENLVRNSSRGPARGCLLGVAAAELEDDQELATAINTSFERIQRLLTDLLKTIPLKASAPSPTELASMLTALLQGIHLMARVDDTESATRAAIRAALQMIDAHSA
ncbi:MAG: TetR/AcrR family transcriptional regulator [Pseudomonadota bacterium]